MKCLLDQGSKKVFSDNVNALLQKIEYKGDRDAMVNYMCEMITNIYNNTEEMRSKLTTDFGVFFDENINEVSNSVCEWLDSMEGKESGEGNTLQVEAKEVEESDSAVSEDEGSHEVSERDENNETTSVNEVKPEVDDNRISLEKNMNAENNTEEASDEKMERKRKFDRRKKEEQRLYQVLQLTQKLYSSDISQAECARLKYNIYSKFHVPFTCVLVSNVPKQHLNIASLAKFFERFGVINDFTIKAEHQSAIIHYQSSIAAYLVMKSKMAVFNDRFIVVEPYYDESDPSTYEAKPVTVSGRNDTPIVKIEIEDRMKLIEDRKNIRNQEIEMLRGSIDKRIDLLKKYAQLATSIEEAKQENLKKSVDKMMNVICEEVGELYKAMKNGNDKEKSDSCIKELLLSSVEAFRNTYLYMYLRGKVTDALIRIMKEYLSSIESMETQGAGSKQKKRPVSLPSKKKCPKVDPMMIDNRSKEVILCNLPTNITENTIITALTGFFGVKKITILKENCIIEFEQAWQTKKPIKSGLFIGGRTLHPKVYYRNSIEG